MNGPAFLAADAVPDLIVAPGSGAIPSRVLSGVDGREIVSGFPFDGAFAGGVRVAAADVDGDGVPDIVAGMGTGGGLVRIISGADGAEIASGFPFGTAFAGGVYVAAADVDGDGRAEAIVGQGASGGRVQVYSGARVLLFEVSPFGAQYSGGVRVAAGDVDGDGRADLIVGQADGGLVSVVDGVTRATVASGFPYGPDVAGGVFVAAGDVDGDGRADAIFGPGSGGGPVRVFDVSSVTELASLQPFAASFGGGVRVAAADFTGDGRAEIIAAAGPGGMPLVHVYSGGSFALFASVLAFAPAFSGGVFVAAPPTRDGIRFTSLGTTTFSVGEPGSFVVRTAGTPPATMVSAAGAMPAGVTFTNGGDGTATFAGTAASGTGGTYPLTLTASNGVTSAITQSFALTVQEAPAITSPISAAFPIGTPTSFTVTTRGFPVPALSSSGTLPDGVTFTPHANGTATIAGTAAPGTTGTFPITILASNGVGVPSTQAFSVVVGFVNQAPSFTPGPDQSVAEDSGAQTVPGWASAMSAGPGEAGQTVTFVVSATNPSLFAVPPALSAAGTLTYTPAPDRNGVSLVTIRLEDDGGTADGGVNTSPPHVLTIAVTPVNDAPVAQPKTFAAHTNMRVRLDGLLTGITDADSGIDGCVPVFAVAAVSATSPAGATVTIVDPTTVDVDPAAGMTGAVTFTYQVSDSGCPGAAVSAPALVTVNVDGPLIWFVDAASPPGGDGRLSHPFSTLAGAVAVSAPNDRLFLFSGTYASGIALKSGETLVGQGATTPGTFDALMGIAPPAGTMARPVLGGVRPILQGTVTLDTGVRLQGLDVTPASGATGIVDPVGAISDVNISEVSVSTSSARAASLSHVSGTLRFTSLSATGGVNGLVLQNTSGTFVVTGTGSAGSGGTIQGTTGDGISLTSAAGVSLSSMRVQNSLGSGLFGELLPGLNMTSCIFTDNGDDGLDAGIKLADLTGTSRWTSLTVTGSAFANVLVDNALGTLDDLTIDGASVFSNLSTTFGSDSIRVLIHGTAVLASATITGATIANNPSAFGIALLAQNTSRIGDLAPGTRTFTIQSSSFSDNAGHVRIEQSGSAHLAFRLLDNLTMVRAMNSHAVEASTASSTGGTLRGRIAGNAIGNAAQVGSGSGFGAGIRSRVVGLATATLLIDGNVIRQIPQGRGIDVRFDGSGTDAAAPTSDLTLTNNDANPQNTNGLPAAAISFAVTSAGGGPVSGRADIRGNTVPPGATVDDLAVFLAVQGAVQLVDSPPASGTCTAQLTDTNTGSAQAGIGCVLIAGPINVPPL